MSGIFGLFRNQFYINILKFQTGLYRLIVRYTGNCDLTEQLVLEALQWFQTFKQYYSCVVGKKDPDPNPTVTIKFGSQTRIFSNLK